LTVAEKMSFWKNNKERKKKEKNGNILGKEQSGAINKIGLNLYSQILSEAIEKMKS